MLALITVGVAVALEVGAQPPPEAAEPASYATVGARASREKQPREPVAVLAAWDRTLQAAARQIAPYVVWIEVERDPNVRESVPGEPAPWARYRDENPAYRQRAPGPASGILLGPDGAILTTHTHLHAARRVLVGLPDGSLHPAVPRGRHERLDLALLQLTPPLTQGLPAEPPPVGPTLGELGLRVGRLVAAVGRSTHPFRHDMTSGIVSALERQHVGLMQVDARLNPGSMGGAIVDVDGNLLGVATGLRPNVTHGYNSGVAFAVPWHLVEAALPDLRAGRVVEALREPFIGIQVDQDVVGVDGVRVAFVFQGHAADRAGLEVGDVLTELGGQRIRTLGDMRLVLRERQIGETLSVTYVRRGLSRTTQLTLTERP